MTTSWLRTPTAREPWASPSPTAGSPRGVREQRTSDSAGLRRRLEPGSRSVHRRPSERAGGARPGVSGAVIASKPGNVPSAVVAFDAANAGRRAGRLLGRSQDRLMHVQGATARVSSPVGCLVLPVRQPALSDDARKLPLLASAEFPGGKLRRDPLAPFVREPYDGTAHAAPSDCLADLLAQMQAALAGRYSLERELGRGGMATVYLARDVKHDRPVALKVLHPELASTLGPERFQREIKLAARLQHPHILTVLDSGEAAGQLWYTMPFVEGESLRERLTRERQLLLEDALRITREVADALGYAHGQGIIHRDIKPENILLSRGHALVADFGLARALQSAAGERLTETGIAVGTPAYMSPEQATAERQVDARSDLYSLGCVLYEMLAGEPPYTGPSALAVIAKRFSEPIPHIRTVRENVPEAIEQAVSKALAKTPVDRYNSAAEFTEALRLASAVRTAGPIGLLRFLRQRPLFAVLVVGFLVGAGVLFGWRRTRGAADRKSTRLNSSHLVISYAV